MNILVFAGTTEGRRLIEALLNMKNVSVCACVATEYGKEILEHEPAENFEIKAGRMVSEEMQKLMLTGFDVVIDATHPYATVVTENIKTACDKTNSKYIRLLRDKTDFGSDCVFVDSTEEAVEYLNTTKGNVLLTTGSKELAKYTGVNNFQERLYARVLPMEQVLKSCNKLGFVGKNLICMQGPFSCEMNKAMLSQLNCSYMVTKDTGKEGGAYEKYQAAKAVGVTLVVVGRTHQETGMSLQQVIKEIEETSVKEILLGETLIQEIQIEEIQVKQIEGLESLVGKSRVENAGIREKRIEKNLIDGRQIGNGQIEENQIENVGIGGFRTADAQTADARSLQTLVDWFPMFANINNKNIAVIGGGKIASRRIKTLLQFSCNLRIVAKEILEEINQLVAEYIYINKKLGLNRSIEIIEKEFDIEDIKGADIVIIATNNREINQSIGRQCKERGMLVNMADAKEECDFYFPGVVMQGDLVVGITAQGKNHSIAKKGTEAIRNAVRDIK